MKTLKELRKERGVKQIAVAEHLGITRQTYAAYEDDPQSMSVAQAKAVCRFLNCPLEDIFLTDKVS